jgi:hypothetical protein
VPPLVFEQSPQSFEVLQRSLDSAGSVGSDATDSAGLHATLAALEGIGMALPDRTAVLSVLAAILHLGNVMFEGTTALQSCFVGLIPLALHSPRSLDLGFHAPLLPSCGVVIGSLVPVCPLFPTPLLLS